MMTFLRSLLFFISVPFFTVFYTLFSIGFVGFLPFRRRFRYLTLWSRTVIFLAKHLAGIQYRVNGLEHIPKDQSFVILAKHQSEWETFFLVNLFQPVRIICKKELFKLPLGVGYGIRLLEPIAIDRKDPRGALKTIQSEGLKSLREDGLPVLIFPEGTRAPVGQKAKYSRSGAQLAIAAEKKVLLVSHNAGTCWPDKGFLKYRGTIDVNISPPIETKDAGFTPKTLTALAEEKIESNLP